MEPILEFDSGTVTLTGAAPESLPAGAARLLRNDERTRNLRGRACDYADIVIALQMAKFPFVDKARSFAPLDDLKLAVELIPRPHQRQAFDAWRVAMFRWRRLT